MYNPTMKHPTPVIEAMCLQLGLRREDFFRQADGSYGLVVDMTRKDWKPYSGPLTPEEYSAAVLELANAIEADGGPKTFRGFLKRPVL